MNARGFTSAFGPQLEAYLAFKEKMGFYGTSRIWYLKQFDAYCAAYERTVFDRDTVEGWVSQQLTRSGRYRSWMSYIRDVGRWLQAHGQRDAYVLSDRWKAAVVPAHPYLLSRREIEAFFATAATLNAASPWRWQAVAFFALMHSCGLRTGETRLLRPEHMHLRDRNLDIVASKGNRSRRLPITRRSQRDPGRLQPGHPRTVWPNAGHVLRLRGRQPGHRCDRREDVQPCLGPGWSPTAGGRSAASALRLPPSLRLRQR